MMSRRSRHGRSDVHVPQIVVTYLGRIAWTATVASAVLVWRIVETTATKDTAADAAVIGIVVAFIGIATGGMAALGAILASTRSSSDPQTPTPVTVENVPANPVPVEVPQ